VGFSVAKNIEKRGNIFKNCTVTQLVHVLRQRTYTHEMTKLNCKIT